jgi:hypothetical protein
LERPDHLDRPVQIKWRSPKPRYPCPCLGLESVSYPNHSNEKSELLRTTPTFDQAYHIHSYNANFTSTHSHPLLPSNEHTATSPLMQFLHLVDIRLQYTKGARHVISICI